MKRIKNWWKKINTPYYKRTIESLQGDEKKDRQRDWFHTGLAISVYLIVILSVIVVIEITGIFLSLSNLWTNTKIIIISISMLTLLIFIMYISQIIFTVYNCSEIQTTLKHMTIQIKQLQKEPCKDINQNQNKFKEEKNNEK